MANTGGQYWWIILVASTGHQYWWLVLVANTGGQYIFSDAQILLRNKYIYVNVLKNNIPSTVTVQLYVQYMRQDDVFPHLLLNNS